MRAAGNVSTNEPYVSAAEVAASYKGVVRRYVALRSVTFGARSEEVTAVVGPNGAGKTTLFRVLLGFLHRDSGRCLVGGLEPAEYRQHRGIGYVPEVPSFPRGWACRDILGRSVDLAVGVDKREDEFALASRRAGFDPRTLSTEARKCSNGTQRRLSIACALINDPEVVLLDEPFAGLDPPARFALRREIQGARDRGTAVIIATHDLPEVARLADRIVFIQKGGTDEASTLDASGNVSAEELEKELFGEQ